MEATRLQAIRAQRMCLCEGQNQTLQASQLPTRVMVQSMASEQAKDSESIDLVTDLQRKLGNLLGLMYSCTGAIQVRSICTICACISTANAGVAGAGA